MFQGRGNDFGKVAHRNGSLTLRLTPEEKKALFRLVREGRRYLMATDNQYSENNFALDMMRILD